MTLYILHEKCIYENHGKGQKKNFNYQYFVIPVKTGIQILFYWIPASAGMTTYLWNATL